MNMKGSLTLLILSTLARGPSHGYQIALEIKRHSRGLLDFKEGTLYPTLHNLEREGLLEAYGTEENGRLRRYYRLTDAGRKALHKEQVDWLEFVDAVNSNLEEGK